LIDERQLEKLTLVEEEEEEEKEKEEKEKEEKEEKEERKLVAEEKEEEEEEEEETEKRSEGKSIRRTRAVSIAMNSVGAVSGQQSGQSVMYGNTVQQQSGTTMMSSSGTTVSSSGANVSQNSDSVNQSEQSLAMGDTFVQEQQEQISGVQQLQVTETPATQVIADSPFEVAEQQQEQQQQQLQQDFVLEGEGTFTQADIQFEDNFTEAMATGGDIGTFLSQQAPDFNRFEIEPPTVTEERIVAAVESLAERVGAEVVQQNLQNQLEVMAEAGGFDNDQTAVVTFLGFKDGFSQYTNQVQIQDNTDWYLDRSIYENVELDDNVFNFYMMAGKTQLKLNEMIQSQYNR